MTRRNFARQNEEKQTEKQDKKPAKDNQKQNQKPATQQPIKRHIISQEMYNNQARGGKKKKKEHGYNNKQ